MKNSSKELTKKELIFCQNYINTGNAAEAARFAGYKVMPHQKASELLLKRKIKEKIESMYKEKRKNLSYCATIGYERLAFGSISDSIKLLFSENLRPEDLDKMDLFNISEIKKPKEGAMEIKFFDRIRALEKLEQINNDNFQNKDPFYRALEESVKKFSNSGKIISEE